MTPYYSQNGITIYCDDCRDVLPGLQKVDLVLTDPPYGINADKRQSDRAGKQHGKAKAASRNYGLSDWDSNPPDQSLIEIVLGMATKSVIWGGNYFILPPSKSWLVWDKQNGKNGYADAELAWTNLDQAVRLIRHQWMGFICKDTGDNDRRVHPTQKPVRVMKWCLSFCPDAQTVIDPFMGSGTTLVAAKALGRKAIGIEISEKYCQIAVERLRQGELFEIQGE